jgi:hypothetical protein
VCLAKPCWGRGYCSRMAPWMYSYVSVKRKVHKTQIILEDLKYEDPKLSFAQMHILDLP